MNLTDRIYIPGMLLIGSAERNVGKTEFSCRLIKHFPNPCNLIAVKITAIDRADGTCPRGGKGCGVCSSLTGDFLITEEKDASTSKDTSRLLASGASSVFWLRVLKSKMREGIKSLREIIGDNVVWLCESNSIASVVKPGIFIIIKRKGKAEFKPSCEKVARFADKLIDFDGNGWSMQPDNIQVNYNQWIIAVEKEES